MIWLSLSRILLYESKSIEVKTSLQGVPQRSADMDKCLDMVFFGTSDMDSDKDPDKLKSLTLDSDWGPTQQGVYDKLHRIYRDFDEIGHVI